MDKKSRRTRVNSHLGNIHRSLLKGNWRLTFLEFLSQSRQRHGLYALYDSDSRLYYVGKAEDLPKRLNDHLKNKHAENWERMTLFFLKPSANVDELESLLIATAKPKGNERKKKTLRVGKDLRSDLQKFLKKDAQGQITAAIFPEKKQSPDALSKRITPKKLKSISQQALADALKVTQGYISQLVKADKRGYSKLIQYIKEGGHRDKIILLLEEKKGTSK